MDSSFGLARSAESPRASLSALSPETESTLTGIAKELEGAIGVSLSERERTIVFLMGNGLSNKGIARQLRIAPETVKSHAKRIFWKLAVQSRAQAVYRAATLGLIALQ